jgi:carbon-monoxide dehydrogenase small subunit
MVMSAVDLVPHHGCGSSTMSEQQLREALEGNICRCTGDHNLVEAAQQGAAARQA